MTFVTLANELTIADVKFGSRARKLGVERGFKIVELKVPNPERPSQNWVFIPAALVAGLVWPSRGVGCNSARARPPDGEARRIRDVVATCSADTARRPRTTHW